tara:strand:+ start:1182 stop:1451 length:270 start_codon:yes stop_codon:yes gene_type:complete
MSDDTHKKINSKGELLTNILKNLHDSDAFICFGVKFDNKGDALAVARYGDREGVVAALSYLLAEEEYTELLPAILEMATQIREKNSGYT